VHAGDGQPPDGAKVLAPEHVDREVESFFAAMRELGDRAGPLVFQFPYFNQTAFGGLAPFLARLPRDFRYAVEVLNKAWLGPELLAVLRAHGVALVRVEPSTCRIPRISRASWTS